jgi:serine/threonine protein kinase
MDCEAIGSNGRYQLTRKIASGGMGDVYLAHHTGIQGFNKQVAIKRINSHHAQDPECVAMFLQEARLAAILDHPNIVQIYELGQDHETYFIVMEYVRGLSLSRCLRIIDGPLSPCIAIKIAAEVANGLQFVHGKCDLAGRPMRMIHRDVSPPNILISISGNVKITDFGIAKFRQSAMKSEAGVIKGKFAYLSPEQARGEPLDHRSDIFSLGLILYEMTTGRKAYEGKMMDVLNRAEHGEVPHPTELIPDYPEDLQAVLMRALAPDPEQRYASCRALQRDLLQLLVQRQTAVTASDLGSFVREQIAHSEGDPSDLLSPSPLPPIEDDNVGPFHLKLLRRISPHRWARAATGAACGLLIVGLVILVGTMLRSRSNTTPSIRFDPSSVVIHGKETDTARPASELESSLHRSLDRRRLRSSPRSTSRRRWLKRRTRARRRGARARQGLVTLGTEPTTEVYLGRRHLGRTPLSVRLPRGRHTLTLRNPQLGLRARRTLLVAKSAVTARFAFYRGQVRFQLPPGRHVQIDGKLLGRTPLPPLHLFEGRYTVTVIEPFRYQKRSFRIRVRPGKTTWISPGMRRVAAR